MGDRPLPDCASEIGATSWAQLCLKYELSHPAVTVVVPGTDDPEPSNPAASAVTVLVPSAVGR